MTKLFPTSSCISSLQPGLDPDTFVPSKVDVCKHCVPPLSQYTFMAWGLRTRQHYSAFPFVFGYRKRNCVTEWKHNSTHLICKMCSRGVFCDSPHIAKHFKTSRHYHSFRGSNLWVATQFRNQLNLNFPVMATVSVAQTQNVWCKF
jgi:hypothetical protein